MPYFGREIEFLSGNSMFFVAEILIIFEFRISFLLLKRSVEMHRNSDKVDYQLVLFLVNNGDKRRREYC